MMYFVALLVVILPLIGSATLWLNRHKIRYYMLAKDLTKRLLAGDRIFLSGGAGVGKTTMIKKIVEQTKDRIVVTAYTGIASTVLSGIIDVRRNSNVLGPTTIHSAACLPVNEPDNDNRIEKGQRKLSKARILIIDEISMLKAKEFDMLLKRVDSQTGILLVGDLLQLPPVPNNGNHDYIFKTPSFSEFKLVMLKHVFRQQDKKFVNFLNRLRIGFVDYDYFSNFSQDYQNQFPTVFGTRNEVNSENQMRISLIQVSKVKCKSILRQGRHEFAHNWFKNQTRAMAELELKKNMRVMCIQNHNDIVNGDLGTLIDFSHDNDEYGPVALTVKFDRLGIRNVGRYGFEKYKISNDGGRGEVQYRIDQFPLVPGYAFTVHKSQGMTLEGININANHINFASGQAYVALSRCKSPSGLRIRNANMLEAFVCEEALQYYQQFDSR